MAEADGDRQRITPAEGQRPTPKYVVEYFEKFEKLLIKNNPKEKFFDKDYTEFADARAEYYGNCAREPRIRGTVTAGDFSNRAKVLYHPNQDSRYVAPEDRKYLDKAFVLYEALDEFRIAHPGPYIEFNQAVYNFIAKQEPKKDLASKS